MSASQFDEFERRMRRINRRHSKLSHGYVTAVNSDGLVVAKPQRRGSRGTLRGVALIVIVIMVFKGFLHAQLGQQAYEERLQSLASGTVIEKAGAFVMAPDPITVWISSKVVSLVR
ncbi:MAG: hypothetical protein KJO42_16290 [Silicimonas sp.]|nr:hypothetical protein [Silicimonas sp.]NNF91564.1 hypothetical protein [Boseongicola sp.]RZW09924.1 MAG: hypothetical protein EX266_04265 [Paracoccaceae bacterium]MBT8424383.1 hypothetical protein [Silicimonas sp.]NND18182.1 hypothetical protein [Silicimonas sp.]